MEDQEKGEIKNLFSGLFKARFGYTISNFIDSGTEQLHFF